MYDTFQGPGIKSKATNVSIHMHIIYVRLLVVTKAFVSGTSTSGIHFLVDLLTLIQ